MTQGDIRENKWRSLDILLSFITGALLTFILTGATEFGLLVGAIVVGFYAYHVLTFLRDE